MNIFVLTLNPAIDLHCECSRFKPFAENLASVLSAEAGGKGVNISRALLAGGISHKNILVLGEENGQSFADSLSRDGVPFTPITLPGRIRENITLHSASQPETRISFCGFRADASLLEKVRELADPRPGDIVTFSGRLPEGISPTDAVSFLRAMSLAGVLIAADSKSLSPEDLFGIRPWFIKPNEEEILALTGIEVKTERDAKKAAQSLYEKGIKNVMISLGAEGACLLCRDGWFSVRPPKIEVKSTIGAGDSAVAGFIAGFVRGCGAEGCLKSAVAYGSAACMEPGTRPPKAENIQKVLASL